MEKVTLETLKKKSDDELLELLGYKSKVEQFKEGIAEADKLTGKAREIIEDEVERMFTPRIYAEDFKYSVESAKQQAARKTGKGEAAYCGCDIVD